MLDSPTYSLLPLFFPYSIIHAWFPELLTYLHLWVPVCTAPSLTVYLVASIPPSRPNSQTISPEPFLNALGKYELENYSFLMLISLSLCLKVLCLYLGNILLWFYWSSVIVCPSAPSILRTGSQDLFISVLTNVCWMWGWVQLFALFTLSLIWSHLFYPSRPH